MKMTVATLKNSFEETVLFDATGNSAKTKVTKTVYDTLAKLDRIVLENNIGLYTTYFHASNKPHLLALLDFEDTFTMHLAIGVQKDSEFLGLFNYHIIKMIQGGQMHSHKDSKTCYRKHASFTPFQGFSVVFFATGSREENLRTNLT